MEISRPSCSRLFRQDSYISVTMQSNLQNFGETTVPCSWWSFYWPPMSVHCYKTIRKCVMCTRNRVNLRRHNKSLQFFPTLSPLEFVSIKVLGKLVKTARNKKYVLDISNRFWTVVRSALFRSVAASLWQNKLWIILLRPMPNRDNSSPKMGSSSRQDFVKHVCRMQGIKNIFMTTYHLQTNGEVEQFSCIILTELHLCDKQHPKDWELYTNTITFGNGTQTHRTTNCPLLELAPSPPANAVVMEPDHKIIPCETSDL